MSTEQGLGGELASLSPTSRGHAAAAAPGHLLVRICFHLLESRVRASTRYLAMGLWLSKPRLQLSWTLVSPMSLTTTPPGGPGGPGMVGTDELLRCQRFGGLLLFVFCTS